MVYISTEEPEISATLEHLAELSHKLVIGVVLKGLVEVMFLEAAGQCHVVELVSNSLDIGLIEVGVGPLLLELFLDLVEESLDVLVPHIIDLFE